MTDLQVVFFGLQSAIVVGIISIAGMIWHLARLIQLHDRRADLEWRAIRAQFTKHD